MEDDARITIDPRVRWGTPCLRDTAISVAHVVALHGAGHSDDEITAACPPLTGDDVAAALAWAARRGPDALAPRPPAPGRHHPNIVVDRSIQGGVPTIRGTRITVDAVLGMWEHGFSVAEILDDYPGLTAEDVHDALAYDDLVSR
jgi:uncharacterized protein (DUF433 family)